MIKKLHSKIYLFSKAHERKMGLDLPYFIKNGFWVGARQMIAVAGGLTLYIVFARFLSKEIFGQYQFILSTWAVVSILSIPGLNTSLMTAIAKGQDGNYKKVVKMSFLWSLIGIPVLWVIGGYYLRTEYALGLSFLATSVLFPFFYAFNTWDSFLQGKSKFDTSAWYFSVQAIVNTVASVIVIIFFRNSLLAVINVYLATFTFFNIFYYYKSLKYVENEKEDNQVVKYGWFLTKMNALGIIAENLDKIMLATFLSPAALAIYSIISVFPVRMRDAIKPLLSVFFPKFVASNGNPRAIMKEKKGALVLLASFVILSAAIYYILIEKINYLFFGESYNQYYSYSKYFTVFFVLYIPLTLMVRYAQAKRMDSIIFISDTSYYVVKIVLSSVLIFRWGVLGAVIAFNISFLVSFIFYFFNLLCRNPKIDHETGDIAKN